MSAYKKSLNSLLALSSSLVLTAGVIMGVILVKENQDFRELADEVKEHKVSICHKTSSESNTWNQIEVSEKALNQHLEHGDIQGNCPASEKEKGNAGKGGSDKQEGIALANSVTVNNQAVESAIPKVETKYVYVTTQFEFLISFQGIDEEAIAKSGKNEKSVRVVFRKGEEELHVYNKVQIKADGKGAYRGIITDVKPGIYDVLVKSDGFLQEKFENINLRRGKNSFNWSSNKLLAGDFNSDNLLNARDVAEFLSFVTEDTNLITDDTRGFDINMNGNLDFDELNLILGNYKELEIRGDD